MKLSFEQLKKITFGAVAVSEREGIYHAEKCTEKQANVWRTQGEFYGNGARTTTGIRLDFHTDGTAFSFRAMNGGKFDLLLDGLLVCGYVVKEKEQTFTCPLSKKDTRVTLIFPSHTVGEIADVEVADATYVTPHKFDRKMLFIGDSITQGWDTRFDSASFAWRTALHENADCVINGIGGTYMLPDAVDDIGFAPDELILASGTNDYRHHPSLAVLEEQCRGMMQKLAELYPNVTKIIITPVPCLGHEEDKPIGKLEDVREILRKAGKDYGYFVIEGCSLVPPVAELYADGWLHPNDLGYSYYAENLINAIHKVRIKA